MTYPDIFENKTGFSHVRNSVMSLCTSEPGRSAARKSLEFSADHASVTTRLHEVAEMLTITLTSDGLPLGKIADLSPLLTRIRAEGTFLTAQELQSVSITLTTASAISVFFVEARNDDGTTPYPALDAIVSPMVPLQTVISIIDRTIDRFGEVRDNASPHLSDIRRSLASTSASLSSLMRKVISKAVDGGYLEADTSAVMRDGRLVLPVSPMNKRKISGIVHDESASGKTFYIEPAELVEANNRIRELQIEEKREIVNILRNVTAQLRPQCDNIITTVDALGMIDFIHAKAMYAAETGGNMPRSISDAPDLEWYHAVHPVLLQSLHTNGKEIVPLDIRLSQKERLLIISGPNAGGKSVCLKTVGIVQYMMQCGMLPPVYENSRMGIFRNIFIDIGDNQSIEDDLSTYSSHLRNMKFFLSRGNDSTLLLIDEFGGGTEPTIGGAIAQAILKEFNEKLMWGVITTHYQNLKNFAEETPGLINGSMLYDRQLMRPLFKLSIGNAGSSFAVEIAQKIGLPENIVSDAEQIVGSDYIRLDKYLLDIARDRRYWERKRDDIRTKEKKVEALINRYEEDAATLSEKRKEILAQAKAEALRIISESNASVERTIREIREVQAEKERTKEIRRRLEEHKKNIADGMHVDEHPLLRQAVKSKKKKSAAQKSTHIEQRPLSVGDNVTLDGQTTVGTIMEISGKNAIVNFGMLKTTVALSRLRHTIAKPSVSHKSASFVSQQTSSASRERQLSFRQEIDVRGMRADEALQAVTYFIDDAIQFSAQRVRILHGTGTGALRLTIRQYLDSVPGVASYADEHVQFGGAGITVVDLE